MDIEIRRGLAEARAMAGEHWQALLVYIGLGVVFPFLLLSSEPIFSLRNIMAIASDPWTNRVGGSITGPLYLLGIVAVITAGAMLAAWNAVLAEMREGYISELMYGMVAGFAYLVANVLLVIVAGVISTLPLFFLGLTCCCRGIAGPASRSNFTGFSFRWSAAGSARGCGWRVRSWAGAASWSRFRPSSNRGGARDRRSGGSSASIFSMARSSRSRWWASRCSTAPSSSPTSRAACSRC